MNGASNAACAPYKKPWLTHGATPIKDADLERILEKLDHIVSAVEQVMDHIAERLGLDLEGKKVGF